MFTFVLLALLAQPGDAPPANGSIAAAVRKRDKLPARPPPSTAEVVLKDGAIILTQPVRVYVPVERVYEVKVVQYETYREKIEVKVGDRLEIVEVTKSRPLYRQEPRKATFYEPTPPRWDKQTIAVKSIKAFVVSKDGKLEALASAKLLEMIAKPTRVLVDYGPEDVDPRHLELIRAGAIYLALPIMEPLVIPHEEIPSPKGAGPADATPTKDTATIEVNLSVDVPLSIDGRKTSSTGTRRIFTTPRLPRGQTFAYEFQAFWPSGRTHTFRVSVQAGQNVWVDVAEPKRDD